MASVIPYSDRWAWPLLPPTVIGECGHCNPLQGWMSVATAITNIER